ncbi:MAG: hypothetical protein HDR45_01970 [Bacteroides sp.]|nr:hypothetical protein [Bacteroidales bacterium]MBD5424947.1 hypothetical protein [Bacteroides sp.]
MNRNSELQAIATELRALTARVEALIAAETAINAEPEPVEQPAPEPVAEPVPEPVAEPAPEPVAEPVPAVEVKPSLSLPLNDRYRFQRELFGGSAAELTALLEKLVPMTCVAEVEAELTARGFDLEKETVKDLLRLTTRRFDAHPPLLG